MNDQDPISRAMEEIEAMDRLEQEARITRMSRMTDKQRDLSAEELDVAFDNFRKFLAAKALSYKQLGRMAGISGSVISELLAGKYKGDVQSAVRKVEAAISDHLLKRGGPGAGGFVMTRIAREIFAIVKTTSKQNGIGVFTGESGLGKSMSLRAVMRQEFPSGIYLEINDGNSGPLGLCRALLKQVSRENVWQSIRSRGEAFNAIVERLSGSGRMIAIDEAENLELAAYNTIRQIHDATGCPVVLAGRPLLATQLDKTQRNARIGGSLRGRICVEHNLMARVRGRSNGRPLFTEPEICEILAKYRVKYSSDAARWLAALANTTALCGGREGGALRYAVKVFEMAMTIAQGKDISLVLVKQASMLLRGGEYGDLIDTQVGEQLRSKLA